MSPDGYKLPFHIANTRHKARQKVRMVILFSILAVCMECYLFAAILYGPHSSFLQVKKPQNSYHLLATDRLVSRKHFTNTTDKGFYSQHQEARVIDYSNKWEIYQKPFCYNLMFQKSIFNIKGKNTQAFKE